MKKFIIAFIALAVSLTFSGCTQTPKIRILNWGEYINDEVVANFEREYGVNVVVDTADSNELFYSKIKSKTTAYDLVIPSDYMIEKMVSEGMLIELDYNKLPNYVNITYMDGVEQILASMTETTYERNSTTIDYKNYAVPYFWGTFGIIYNNRVEGLEASLQANGWDTYFDAANYFPTARRGMYDVAQFAYAASMFYLGENPNDYSPALLSASETAIRGADFSSWGDDILKRDVEADNLDMAFVYTGDYLDRLYIQLDEGKTMEEVQADFNIYIPETTMVFADCMVIPYTAKNIDGAHQFINYLLDPDNMALNASVVGYCTTTEQAYDIVVAYLGNAKTSLDNWAKAYLAYYNKDREGTYYPLTSLPSADIDAINTMIQNVIAGD